MGVYVIMVRMIIGDNGKGKSKVLLEKVNADVKEILGNVVFLDSSTKHMYELNNKIRLINVSEYFVNNSDMFVGFLSGIISQDHDLQQMYFDSFLKISCLEGADISAAIDKLEKVSEATGVDFILSVSMDAAELPEAVKEKIIISL